MNDSQASIQTFQAEIDPKIFESNLPLTTTLTFIRNDASQLQSDPNISATYMQTQQQNLSNQNQEVSQIFRQDESGVNDEDETRWLELYLKSDHDQAQEESKDEVELENNQDLSEEFVVRKAKQQMEVPQNR